MMLNTPMMNRRIPAKKAHPVGVVVLIPPVSI
jgi:hypothetical protein